MSAAIAATAYLILQAAGASRGGVAKRPGRPYVGDCLHWNNR